MEVDDDVRRTNTGPDAIIGLMRLSCGKFKKPTEPTDASGSTAANSKVLDPSTSGDFVR
jgi:hypothetical protein